jgi:GDP-4-dehydro-6-deoxy-D-mannose reductase
MRVLVTGATGFVGRHLTKLLVERRHEVYGTHIDSAQPSLPGVTLVRCDLREQQQILDKVAQIKPERVYHLAALSSVRNSFVSPEEVHRTNFWGTLHLLESLQRVSPHSRTLLISSSQVYDLSQCSEPLTESAPLAPQSPYAVSKMASELLGYEYFSRYGLFVVRARPFNHTGPGQSAEFVCSDFARQFAAIAAELQPAKILTGALQVKRDFSDVRDVVRADELLMERGEPGEVYNVASQTPVTLEQVLAILKQCCEKNVEVIVEKARLRANDPAVVVGSYKKLRDRTGWEPHYDLQRTLTDLFNYWREELLSRRSTPLPVS